MVLTNEKSNIKRREKYRKDIKYRERVLEECHNYYRKNKDIIYARRKKYFKERYHEEKKRISNYCQKRNKIYRDKIYKILGNICSQCGFSDTRCLQVDHKNGGGNKDRKKFGTNTKTLYENIKKNKENYQILCANCNWIKKYEQQETTRKH